MKKQILIYFILNFSTGEAVSGWRCVHAVVPPVAEGDLVLCGRCFELHGKGAELIETAGPTKHVRINRAGQIEMLEDAKLEPRAARAGK